MKPFTALHCQIMTPILCQHLAKKSLFNTMTFKTMATFMAALPAATYFAFHPHDNNIIAIGMEDSTILIYNVRFDEVKLKTKTASEKDNKPCFLCCPKHPGLVRG